jgi:hypothetical protein
MEIGGINKLDGFKISNDDTVFRAELAEDAHGCMGVFDWDARIEISKPG